MNATVLSRYLDPFVLNQVADHPLEPRGLVSGNLAGAHKSPFAGFAVEFAGHREYAPGDDPKYIDWRVYFTRDKYFVKQFEMETNFTCHLFFDTSASMRYGADDANKLLYAGRMVATLAYAILRQRDKVSFAAFDDQVRTTIAPSNSFDQASRIIQELDGFSAERASDFGACLMELARRTNRREIVMIFSDFFGDLAPLEAALQMMRFHGHEVILFQVLHHDERQFEFDGMFKFEGLETAAEEMLEAGEVRQAYLSALRAHIDELAEICRRNVCEMVAVDTSLPLRETFFAYLSQREAAAGRRGL